VKEIYTVQLTCKSDKNQSRLDKLESYTELMLELCNVTVF